MRMSDSEISKQIMNYNPEGKRRAGRPNARWIDAVESDMRTASVRNWRMEAKDRDRLQESWKRPRLIYRLWCY
jgi:hypothetical protein